MFFKVNAAIKRLYIRLFTNILCRKVFFCRSTPRFYANKLFPRFRPYKQIVKFSEFNPYFRIVCVVFQYYIFAFRFFKYNGSSPV